MGGKAKDNRRWLLEDEAGLPPGSELLLHVCCAPCSAGSLRRLCELFRVTMYFTNSNIHPEEEYQRRLEAARTLAVSLDVPLLEAPYDPEAWAVAVQGLETADEGGERCGAGARTLGHIRPAAGPALHACAQQLHGRCGGGSPGSPGGG